MKDAPINLPLLPEWMLHFNGQPTRQGFEAQDYARAAVLADRSGREAFWPTWVKIPTGAAPMVPSPSVTMTIGGAAPSPAEPPRCKACGHDPRFPEPGKVEK
jgi:hypothetical protein